MKILYDYQIFTNQVFGGISRYFNELNSSNPYYNSEISLIKTRNEYLLSDAGKFNSNFYIKNKGLNTLFFNYNSKVFEKENELNKQYSIEKLNKGDFNIFHPTYYNDYFLDQLNKPFVLTIYDLADEVFFLNNPLNIEVSKCKLKLAQKASKIIAISMFTKKQINEFLAIPLNKIEVVHLAASNKIYSTNFKLPKSYILYVGNRGGEKNFENFILSIKDLLLENADLFLICTGNVFLNAEKKWFKELGILNKIKHIFCKETQLYYLYRNAILFVYPSKYEGFGIPILEAFNANCPAFLSDIEVFHEVAGDAAFYFNPNNINEMNYLFKEALNSKSLRDELIQKGNLRKNNFSWDKVRNETFKIYKELI